MKDETYRKAWLEQRCTCPYTSRACPQHSVWRDETTTELETRELPVYDENDAADTLPEQGVTE